MLLLDALPKWGTFLTPLQETITDTLLLTTLATPLIWLFSLRPLAIKWHVQQISNQQLLKALDIHALVSTTDLKGRITHVNNQFCDVSGYSEKELLGQDHRIVNSGYHDKAFIRNLWQTITVGKPWQGEICNRNSQGHLFWVDTTIAPLLGHDGKPKQYISIRRDITELKENENRLLTLKRALDASNEMILVTDCKGFIQYVNPALSEFTGWAEEKIIGKSATVFDSPNTDPKILDEMKQYLRKGNPWAGRLLNQRRGSAPFNIAGQSTPPDSREYWADISITNISNDEGELLGYVQIQRDISEQVNKERAIKVERADDAARLDISQVLQLTLPLKERVGKVLEILFNLKAFDLQRKGGLFIKDPDADFLDMYVLSGQFSKEFIEREQRISYGDCLCGRAAISQELIVSDDCFCDPRHEHVFEGMKAHGHYIVPIVSSGITLGILFLYTDPYPIQIHSRLNMLQQVGDMLALALLHEQARLSLEAARSSAEQTAKIKSEFLANMSHEIRTPMNGILGMLDIMKDTELTREQQDLIDTACNSAESLLNIINDILDFSKLDVGKIELEKIEFNLPVLVEEVCALLSTRAHEKDLELNCFLPADLPVYWQGDPNRIRQVLINLIGNGVKFTEQGEVSVSVFTEKSDSDDYLVRFEVKDTGIGLSPESQAHLFQPFAQADSSTARRFGGTGLGLSISKDLVELMQGNIGVEGALDEGSCFWFDLPLAPLDSAKAAFDTDLSATRVLVVDDNATNRKILNHYLEHWGAIVTETDNAPAAIEALEAAVKDNQVFDMVLTDLHMPDMNGYELAHAISRHSNPAIASIPRLLLTSGGLTSSNDQQEAGFIHSLLKPVRQTQLLEAIISALKEQTKKTLVSEASKEDIPDYSSKRILVTEDNIVNQKVILAMLSKFNCTPDVAENGQEALDKIIEQSYDLVFMDCQMPVMDGYQAVRSLRERELNQSASPIPVIALTAHASDEERDKCLAAGMDDFLSKPILRLDLAKMLEQWLGRSNCSETYVKPEEISIVTEWDEDATLKALDDDVELLNEMIDLFLGGCPVKLQELKNASDNSDLREVASAAHAIKGMGGHFYANRLIAYADKLECCARQEKAANFQAMVNSVIDLANSLIKELAEKRRGRDE